jgi:hypothetical protein
MRRPLAELAAPGASEPLMRPLAELAAPGASEPLMRLKRPGDCSIMRGGAVAALLRRDER